MNATPTTTCRACRCEIAWDERVRVWLRVGYPYSPIYCPVTHTTAAVGLHQPA